MSLVVFPRKATSPLLLGEVIGYGSHATVRRGALEMPHGLSKPVAVKHYHCATDAAPDFRKKMRASAVAAAQIDHPNLISILDCGETAQEEPFVVMELCRGRSLADVVLARGHRLPLDAALLVVLGVAEAVSAALDGSRLLHGGLSMRQVILTDRGDVKVGDFGEASAVGASSRVHRDLSSRLSYVSPEVANDEEPTPRSDVFALGVMMHELLLGPRFPQSIDAEEWLGRLRDGRLDRPVFAPLLPADLGAVMTQALQRRAEDRYRDATAFADALRRVILPLGLPDARSFLRSALPPRVPCDATVEVPTVPWG